MNAQRLNRNMKKCIVPQIFEYVGVAKSKVDCGLDDDELNPNMAERRERQRRLDLE